jgi:mannose-1-phosphate guanylyltransferase
MSRSSRESAHRQAVVVAGGSGTRLWPVSRQALPKQMQSLMTDTTLIEETVQRLEGLIPIDRIWVSTTANYRDPIAALLPDVPPENFIVEPEGRGPTVAFALLAHYILARDPEAVVFSLASDHAVTEVERFQDAVRASMDFIERNPSNIALIGIKPTRADTGLGYIRVKTLIQKNPPVYRAGKYVEKPSLEVALDYLQSGQSYWNAAYYCFRAETLLSAYADADARLVELTAEYLRTGDLETYRRIPSQFHEIDIIDSAKHPIVVVPGDFRWSDIGNWGSLHRTLSKISGSDIITNGDNQFVDVNSKNVYVRSRDDRDVVVLGVKDIAIICDRDSVFVASLEELQRSPDQSMKELLQQLKAHGKEGLF